ncbi:substrate-binding domain-containing protein [filamentous cyanobacterium LEGE 11480]|uniref:Substrate-binding domain-containing protein n=1 Tax=Romeriopsis navalis LEGE 11480 TaxID=2777977 RepID=A0A928Z783_9CYAN|nr:substrate-binding domain-containing protein [Romeriopsis navalis]MBE9033453.1 substrate-binding domain-containing protein [Romeriopsis navalis LEGE 11480]
MSGKNETPALIGAFLITVGLIGGGVWLLSKRGGISTTSNNAETIGSSSGKRSDRNGPAIGDFKQVQNIPTGRYNYGGSTSFAPIRLAVDAAVQVARPEFQLNYVNPVGSSASSGSGIRMLLNRQLDFSQSSRPLKQSDRQKAQSLGIKLEEAPVAIDGIAVAVNPTLGLPGLTIDQLKGIYSGQIQNWQEVGGPNLPITPLSRNIGSGGTVDFFVESVLGGSNFGSAVEMVNTTTQALQRLGSTPGGIYYASAPEVVPQCTVLPLAIGRSQANLVTPYREPLIPSDQCPGQRNQLNESAMQSGQYPLTRNLYVIWKADNGRSQQAGKAYTELLKTQQARDLMLKAGFVPL